MTKKRKKGLIIVLVSAVVLIGGVVLTTTVLMRGLLAPRDLGVRANKAAYESAIAKLNYDKNGELQDVDTSLTSEELTSFFSYNKPDDYALKKVQIRINSDDTVEFSGEVKTDYIFNTVLEGKYSEEEINNKYPLFKYAPDSVNVYAQISGEIKGNQALVFDVDDVEIMGVNLPASFYNAESSQEEIKAVINDYINNNIRGDLNSVKVRDGELLLKGKLPSSGKNAKQD